MAFNMLFWSLFRIYRTEIGRIKFFLLLKILKRKTEKFNMQHQNRSSRSNRTYLYSWVMVAVILFYVFGTFHWRNWTITLNLRAYLIVMLITGRKPVVPIETRQYVLYNSFYCLIIVLCDVDDIIRIRLILVCPKWSRNWVFDRLYNFVLCIIHFVKL